MAEISATYASPGLRWGLLLEDHPGADYEFHLEPGSELGIPKSYGGDGQFCVCVITFPQRQGEHRRAPVKAWKPADRGNPDAWNLLCTKTLGRALKRAGYPDDLTDLKALVLWRQREAEIEQIKMAPLAIEATARAVQPTAELVVAPTAVDAEGDPEPAGDDAPEGGMVAGDDAPEAIDVPQAPQGAPGPLASPPAAPTPGPPTDEQLSAIRAGMGKLSANRQRKVTHWAKNREPRISIPRPATADDAGAVLAYIEALEFDAQAEPPAEDHVPTEPVQTGILASQVDRLLREIVRMTHEEMVAFGEFLRLSVGVQGDEPGSLPDIKSFTAEQATEALSWFDEEETPATQPPQEEDQ